eukprot:TRINITY_DN1179_c0_g3_i5.p2 TRINITY_DN1179_c0_g3~~TRINITY_DN1179_c0_g3_i5.p2  ORF type:complete len:134 (-),score=12.14 TRINITY_DN1179_c0_g3_i5:144-545(-)
MAPTLNPSGSSHSYFREVVLLNRLPRYRDFKRGDVVALVHPTQPEMMITKRIIGLPHDIIRTAPHSSNTVILPEGFIWVEGDNAEHSVDSRHFGPVPLGLVQGRIEFVVFPFHRFRRIESSLPAHRVLPQLWY